MQITCIFHFYFHFKPPSLSLLFCTKWCMRPSERFLWPAEALGRDSQPVSLSPPQPWDTCEDRPQFPSLFGWCVGSSPTLLLVYMWRCQEKCPTACLPNDAVIWVEACVEHKDSMILLEAYFKTLDIDLAWGLNHISSPVLHQLS